MIVKITSKRQVTFPAKVLEAMGVQPGDHLEIREEPGGYRIRPRRVDGTKLAPLAGRLKKGHGSFDLKRFRSAAHDPALRD